VARLAPEKIVGLVDYCIRRKAAYPFRIDSPAYDRAYEPTYFTDITRAVESLFLPHVHRDAEAAGDRLPCALCGTHPKSRYFCNARPDNADFAPARWPDGRHDDVPPYRTDYWPKPDDPPRLAAGAPAICIHCVARNWVMDEERLHGALIALERSDDVIDVAAAVVEIQAQYPSRVVRVAALERCTICTKLEHAVIKGRELRLCQPCFERARTAMRPVFRRLETERRILDPPDSM
jgi:hypothetical protein